MILGELPGRPDVDQPDRLGSVDQHPLGLPG
jgi:hypothetical protein